MTISECAALLRGRDDFLLVTHARPDGDTLCSAAALCSGLRRAGKRAAVLENPEMTDSYAPYIRPYTVPAAAGGEYIVCVDTADVNLFPIGFAGEVPLCIDHHASNTHYAADTVVDSSLAACGELVLALVEELCGGLTKEEADLLYIAVSTDCGCFCYANTTPRTLRDAAHLIECGAENARLNKEFFRSFSFARLALEGLIYSSMRSYRNNSINVAVVTLDMMKKSGATEDDCDDLASLAGKVKGNVVAITIRELAGGGSKASVRTNELVNASEVCRRYGGGGHPMAAGCTSDLPPFEFADRLVETVDEIWK